MNVARHGRELGQRRVRRHRLNISGSVAPPIVTPPVVSVPPTLVLSADGLSLIYTAGVWSGTPTPTVTATLNIIGVGSVPASPNMPIEASWRGRNVNVSESAINAGGGPVVTQTPNLAIPTLSPVAPTFELFGTTLPDVFAAVRILPETGPLAAGTVTLAVDIGGSPVLGFTPITVTEGMTATQLRDAITAMANGKQTAGGVTLNVSNGGGSPVRNSYNASDFSPITVLTTTFAAATPESDLVAWLAGRVGYGLDPHTISTLFQDTAGAIPVTADGQPVGLARSRFDPVTPAVADFLQSVAAQQPAYQAGSLDPDGVDDILPYNYGATGVMPIFQGINGFVASVLVEMVSLATNQVVWVSGFGGTAANFRHRIRVTTTGAIQFSAQDAQNGAPVSVLSATGLITVGTKALITLAVDHDAKVLKGYLNGVEVASLALPNTVSPFNYDINRARFFAQHGNTATELFGGKLYRAFFFHGKINASDRQIIENWVGEFAA